MNLLRIVDMAFTLNCDPAHALLTPIFTVDLFQITVSEFCP